MIEQLKEAKEERVEAQYYPVDADVHGQELLDGTKSFVYEIEKLIDSLNSEKILPFKRG